ncbi:MAG: hypothetical protein JRI68_17970 [Deltaproteobacteria bacterium]|nr:hypothetical protein [Deltaproteobacteria bacterium]
MRVRLHTLVAAAGVLACGSDTATDSTSTSASTTTSTSSGAGGSGGATTTTTSTGGAGGSSNTPCFPAGLQDDFSGGSLDLTTWNTIGVMGFTVETLDDRLTFTPTAGYTNTRVAGVRSISTFDLTECTTWVEVPRMPPADFYSEVMWSLGVGAANDGGFMRVTQATDLQIWVDIDGDMQMETLTYDSAAHRWWRFRDTEGIIYLETSPDGADWTVRNQRAHSWDLNGARISFYANAAAGSGDFPGPQFDNLNVAP